MIVFDLRCGGGHVFEAWFGSGDDYDAQSRRGLVSCPVCGNGEVTKAAMAPAVPAKANSGVAKLPVASADAPSAEKMKAMMRRMAKAQAEMLKGSEHVGRRFADEARAIHLGDADARTIHGEASIGEARALAEEGVPVAPLPFPARPTGGDN